ncbi:hypothetical protein N185_15655 [Sinorhizobium sp. GW3]|nr:hypothetical protein N185_15655 [Sinorhizobium sp. GW3]
MQHEDEMDLEALPAAWSNGQWIWLDLQRNRYKGGEVMRDADLQALQALATVKLQTVAGNEKPLVPPLGVLAHYIRSAWIARKARYLPIADQLALLQSAQIKYKTFGDTATFAWLYQHMRNLRIRRPLCLEDSVCCALFLLRYVEAPSFCIGVKQPPFMAHAWVQVGDVLVNDVKAVVETYSEIVRLDL